MKKILLSLLVGLSCRMGWADTKISAMSSTTTLNSFDIIPVVTNPSGSAANFSITKTNLSSTLNVLTQSSATANFIQLRNSLQAGATFYVSSGSVSGQLTVNGQVNTPLVQTQNIYDTNAVQRVDVIDGILTDTSDNDSVDWQNRSLWASGGADATYKQMNWLTQGLVTFPNSEVQIRGADPVLSTGTLQSGATFYVSSGTVSGQLTAGTYQGASLATCGDGTHALSWASGSFGCQSITGTGGGGSSSLAFSSGSATNSVVISSPTSNIVVDSNTFIGSLQGTTTTFLRINGSSVTLQSNTFNGASQLVKTNSSTQLPAISGALLTNLTGNAIATNIPSGVLPSTIAYITSTQTISGQWTHTNTVVISTTIGLSTLGGTGTSGQVLTSAGPGAIPTWSSAGAGDAVLAGTQTFSGGNTFTGSTTFYNFTILASTLTLGMQVNFSSDVRINGSAGTSGQAFTSQGYGSPPIWSTIVAAGDNLGNGVGSFGVATTTGGFTGAGGVSVTFGVTAGSVTAGGVNVNTQFSSVATDTTSIRTSLNAVSVATGTLALNFPVSLSTNVAGTLPAANMVSTTTFNTSTQTFSAQKTFTATVVISTTIGLSTIGGTGTSGQVLTSAGPGSVPTWSSAGSGDMVLASTQTSTGQKTFTATVVVSTTVGLGGAGTTGSSGQMLTSQGTATTPIWSDVNKTTYTWTAQQTHNYTVVFSSTIGLSSVGGTGTNGQILTSGGPGAVPTWTTVSGTGDAVLASTQTWSGKELWNSPERSTFTVAPTLSNRISVPLATDANGAIISTGVFQPDSVATLTNKTIDAEGTGNSITIPFQIMYKAGICQAGTASLGFSYYTSSGPTATCVPSSSTIVGVASFIDGSTTTVQDHFRLPTDWTGNIDLQLVWYSSVTTNQVAWEVRTACISSGTFISPIFNAYDSMNSVAVSRPNGYNQVTKTSLTATGCTADSELFFEIARNGSNPTTDTHANAASLVSAMFTIRRAM